jgi:hypothetical protein
MKNTYIAGSRVYNFEIRQSTTGVRYLVIDEIQAEDRHRLMVFEEYWDGFLETLSQLMGQVIEPQVPPTPPILPISLEHETTATSRKIPEYVLKIRQSHPRAYEPWTPEEEQHLVKLQKDGCTVNQLSQEFQRHPGAIRSRLRKINLREA